MPHDNKLIFGYTFAEIQARQQGSDQIRPVDVSRPGDYGADPIGDGKFRMVPSGDIVDTPEINRRLRLKGS